MKKYEEKKNESNITEQNNKIKYKKNSLYHIKLYSESHFRFQCYKAAQNDKKKKKKIEYVK